MQSGWRRWIALFAMLAFALQVQLTQTHIHNPSAPSAIDELASGLIAKPAKDSPAKNSPLGDPANCPICQAVSHGGQFVTPSAIALILPSLAIAFVPVAIAATTARDSVSHNWQGRAPPRH